MLLNEFRKEIESLNEISMGQYQLHIDEQMSKHVYTTMSYTRGVACFPYVVDNKLMMLYCFTDLDLLRKFDRAMLHRTIERQCSLSQEVLLRLFENRINYCDKLPLSESVVELALYYYKENLIDANYFNKPNKINFKSYPAGKLLSVHSLDDIKLVDDKIYKNDNFVKLQNLKSKHENSFVAFGVNGNNLVLNNKGLLKILKSCESDISNSCEKIMNQINLNKNVETESCRLKTFLRRGLANFKVIENLIVANDEHLEFYRCLTDHKALQNSKLVNKSNTLYVLGKLGYILKDVGVMPKVIKLLKSIHKEGTCYTFGCKQSRTVFNDKNELLKFIHSYNVDNVLPKLHVDFSNNSLLYKETLELNNTIASVIDVADKQVMLYHVYNEDEHILLNTIHKDLKERKGFTKEQISNIVINSFMNMSKCSLPLAMSVAYITLAKSNSIPKDLLSNISSYGGRPIKLPELPRNLYEFVCTYDASNIQISHGNVYLRCNAACKARGFKTIVKYDESINSYYTIVKFRSNGWVGVDNTINVIELVREFEKSGEFDNNCDKHFLHLTNNLKEFMNNKDAKKNKDIDNIIKFYEVGKKYAHNNKLIVGLEDLKAKIKCDDIVQELKKCKAI